MSLCLITTPQTLVITVIDYGRRGCYDDGIYDIVRNLCVPVQTSLLDICWETVVDGRQFAYQKALVRVNINDDLHIGVVTIFKRYTIIKVDMENQLLLLN